MIWQRKTFKPIEAIARTGFLVSLASYVVFWLVDVVQPGFVSRYFSVHVFLLAAIVFAALWVRFMSEYRDRPLVHAMVSLAFGVFLAVISWSLTEDLELYRLPLALVVLVSPMMVYSFLRS